MHLRAYLNIQKGGEKDIYLILVCPVLFEVLVMYLRTYIFFGKKAELHWNYKSIVIEAYK